MTDSTKDLVDRLREPMSEMDWDAAMIERIVHERIDAASALTAAHARIAELEAKLVGVMDAWEHDQAKAKIALDQRDTAERERDEKDAALIEIAKHYAAMKRERDEARAALEPFALVASALDNGALLMGWKYEDHEPIAKGDQGEPLITIGQLRAARNATGAKEDQP